MQVSETVYTTAASLYGIDPTSLRSLGGSEAAAYSCRIGSRAYVIKFKPISEEQTAMVQERQAFTRFLAENNVPVAEPVESLSGALFEVVREDEQAYAVTVALHVSGRHATSRNLYYWNENLFIAWGRAAGKLHTASRAYPSWQKESGETSIPDWREEFAVFSPGCSEPKILGRWTGLVEQLEGLPRDRASYGLAHNDLHPYNFLYHPEPPAETPLTIVDLDICGFHWFLNDIAVPLYHAVTQTVPHGKPDQRMAFARQFIKPFLFGYLQENDLNLDWLVYLPLFLKHREIVSYLALLQEWPEERRARWQNLILNEKRARIARGEALIPSL